MKKSRRNLVSEIIVVLLVLVVLLIVMFPKFKGAQVRSKVSQAFEDLSRIRHGMQAYNMDWSGYGAQTVYINRPWEISNLDLRFITLNNRKITASRGLEERMFGVELPPESIASYLGLFPSPQFPKEVIQEGNFGWRHYYAVSQKEHRDELFNRPDSKNPHGSESLKHEHFFGRSFDHQWLGSSHAPLLDLRKFQSSDKTDFYVEFNPSNGLMSHGFLYQRDGLLPKEKRMLDRDPLPPEERETVPRKELEQDDIFSEESKQDLPDLLTMKKVDAESLYHRHQTIAATMEIHLQGNKKRVDSLRNRDGFIVDSLKGIAPCDVTFKEIKNFLVHHGSEYIKVKKVDKPV